MKARDGYDYDGYRLRVEFPRGGGPGSYRGSRGSDRNRGEGRSNRGPVTKRSQYRVLVSGLPPSGSWQDLKDHMREAGDVCFADTYKDGTGVVEFLRLDDMKYAIKKLDDSRFRSHEVSTGNESFLVRPFGKSNFFDVFREKWLMSEYVKISAMIADVMDVTGKTDRNKLIFQSTNIPIHISIAADHVLVLHFHRVDVVALQPIHQFVAAIPDLVQTPGQTTKNIFILFLF